MTETCESCGMARHGYGLNGCVNQLLHEAARLHAERDKARAERDRYRAELKALAQAVEDEVGYAAEVMSARAALNERKHGPSPACPECGMGGDVGGTEPNPIPF